MLIPLIVFGVVVHGIAGTGDLRRVGRVLQPGAGMNVDPTLLDASALSGYAAHADKLTGDVLQVLLFSILFGCALALVGVLGAIAFTVGKYGIGSIKQLGMLVLVLSVDWFMGIARALGNLIGNCVATVATAAWEGDIDLAQARAVLDGQAPPAAEAP